MDRLQNPYAPGAGVPPPALTGRQDEIDAFATVLQRLKAGRPENSLILYGLRGVGKTVLLRRLQGLAEKEKWQTLTLEARAGMDFQQALARGLYLGMRRLEGLGDTMKEALGGVYRALASFELRYSDNGWSLGLAAKPQSALADSGDLEADLTDLLITAADAAKEADSGLALFVDEMQLMPRDAVEALVSAFHEASQRTLPLCLAGAGLPQLPGVIVNAKTYAERLFSYRKIDSLSETAARDALRLPAEKEGIAIEPAALEAIAQRAGRYPYFLQVYGKHAWDAAPRSPITLADIDAVTPDVIAELDEGFFYARWEKATQKEREYMSAMALGGDSAQQTRDIAERMGRQPSDVSVQRDSLIKKGLIYASDHGLVDFTAPLFADYIRRTHPQPRPRR